jgi:AraC-like DNA-binding protein
MPSLKNPGEQQKPPQEQLVAACRRLDEFSFEASAFVQHGPLRRLKCFIDENPSKQINLKHAASEACLEPRYFGRFFHRRVGVSFGDWNSYRLMQRGLALLAGYESSITDIAEDCGFSNLRTFERHCQKWTGLPPRTIRDLLQDANRVRTKDTF